MSAVICAPAQTQHSLSLPELSGIHSRQKENTYYGHNHFCMNSASLCNDLCCCGVPFCSSEGLENGNRIDMKYIAQNPKYISSSSY